MSKITQLKKKLKKEQQTPKEQAWSISEGQLIMDILTGDISWNQISKKNLSNEFINEYQNQLNWPIISSKKDLSKQFFDLYADKLEWKIICCNYEMKPAFIRKYKDYVNWDLVARNGFINDEIFEEFFEELYCDGFINMFSNGNCEISSKVIEKYEEYYDDNIWKYISNYRKLSEEFINKYSNKLNWNVLSETAIFTQEQIIKYKKLINWNKLNRLTFWKCRREFIRDEIIPRMSSASVILLLLEYYNIDEYHLEKITNPNVWKELCYSAKLSDKFIRKHKKYINKHGINSNGNIDYSVKLKLKKDGII